RDRIANGLTIVAAGDDDRDFPGKVDPRFRDTGDSAESGPGARGLRRFTHENLALAVVARRRSFENQRQPKIADRPLEFGGAAERTPRSMWDRVRSQKALFTQPILANPQCAPARSDRAPAGQPA